MPLQSPCSPPAISSIKEGKACCGFQEVRADWCTAAPLHPVKQSLEMWLVLEPMLWELGSLERSRWMPPNEVLRGRYQCQRLLDAWGEGRAARRRRDGAINVEKQSGHAFSTAPGDLAL